MGEFCAILEAMADKKAQASCSAEQNKDESTADNKESKSVPTGEQQKAESQMQQQKKMGDAQLKMEEDTLLQALDEKGPPPQAPPPSSPLAPLSSSALAF